jgi:hypothetical protein
MKLSRQAIVTVTITLIMLAASIVGLVNEVPQLIVTHGHLIPVWLRSANLWWCIGLFAIYLIAILFVLSPWKRKRPDTIESLLAAQLDHYLTVIGKSADKKTPAETDRLIVSIFEHDLPAFIQSAISKAERAKYDSAIAAARENGVTIPIALFRIATQHVLGMIVKMGLARVDRMAAGPSAIHPNPPAKRDKS